MSRASKRIRRGRKRIAAAVSLATQLRARDWSLLLAERDAINTALGQLRGCVTLMAGLVDQVDADTPAEIDAFDLLIVILRGAIKEITETLAVADERHGPVGTGGVR